MPGGVLGVLVIEVSLFCNQHIIHFNGSVKLSCFI